MDSPKIRIAVLANLKENAPPVDNAAADFYDDLDGMATVQSIVQALEAGGHDAQFIEASLHAPHNVIEALQSYRPDLCFNIAEGHWGDGREAQIPGLLEMLRIPYTGSQVLTLALTLDKPMTKRILRYHNLPTAEFQVFERSDDPLDDELLNLEGELRFPLFVKPSREGTGIGVSANSIVHNSSELRLKVEELLTRYNQPILAERFIQGREITVGVLGNLPPTAARRIHERASFDMLPEELSFLPPLEVDMSAYPSESGIYTNRVKVELVHEFAFICPAPLDAALVQELNRLSAAVFRVTGCKDVARVDFRLDESQNNQPYILEVNPLPGLNPDYSDLCIEGRALGWSYEQLINTIAENAIQRYGLRDLLAARRVQGR